MRTRDKIARILTKPAMVGAYGRWCLARLRGHGPYVRAARNCRVGTKWVNCSEYWTYRNGIQPRERRFLSYCYRQASGAPTSVDVGANVGLFTVEMAAIGFHCHSFEPLAATHQRLRENVTASGLQHRVKFNEVAIGEFKGDTPFLVDDHSPGTNHVRHAADLIDPAESEIRVPITTIDGYMIENDLQQIHLMKVDAEGFEAAVFRGAKETLRRGATNAILFEVCPAWLERAGESAGSLKQILNDFGYSVHRLAEDGSRAEELSTGDLNAIVSDNVVAVPK